MNHKKSRLTDLFRKMDKDNNGLIPRHEFIDGIINTSEYTLACKPAMDITYQERSRSEVFYMSFLDWFFLWNFKPIYKTIHDGLNTKLVESSKLCILENYKR